MPSQPTFRPERPPVTSARSLAEQVGAEIDAALGQHAGGGSGWDASITGIELRGQSILPGDLFAALPGARAHGASFAADALARGAVAVLTDPAGREIVRAAGVDVGILVHPDPRSVLGVLSSTIYGHPSRTLSVIGITGTSGKTTTSYLTEAALRASGRTTGLIGTIETRIGDEPVPSALTTPEAPNLHAVFAAMVERGVDTVVMEVSSHALSLGRVDGTRFAVGAFTNLSQDHLDFHETFEDYFAAKARLFAAESSVHAGSAVVCVDDDWGRRMAAIARSAGSEVVTVSGSGAADWSVVEWAVEVDGAQSFTVSPLGTPDVHATLRLPGRYNVANAIVAAAACAAVGVDPTQALDAMAEVDVPGRVQPISRGQDFLAVVDYAHKPAALEVVIDTLRRQTRGRIAVVVGAGGDRDSAKRPLMGAAAAERAELVVITDDNPRTEDPALIRQSVLAGAETVSPDRRGEVRVVGDRREAIAEAVRWARSGDTILVAGKGHEVGQEIDGVKHPFDDRTVLAEAIDAIMGGDRS